MALRLLILVFLSVSHLAQAESLKLPLPKRSKFEAGIAVGGFHLPDYPGADESHTKVLPLPYLFYRGQVFRADREGGLRGRVLHRDRFEFDVSAQAAFPVESTRNQAREGMPSLDWLGEIGPRLVYHAYVGPMVALDLKLPIRYVFSTDFQGVDSRGFTMGPQAMFRHRTTFDPHLVVVAKVEGTWATQALMDYLYAVDSEFATVDRPSYEAEPGFLAANASLSAVRVFPEQDTVVFAGVSFNNFSEAENRASPLLRDITTQSFYLGVAVSVWESEQRED